VSFVAFRGATNFLNPSHSFNNFREFAGFEFGTMSQLLDGRSHPQYIVVPNNPVPDIKTQGDNLWRNLASKYILFLQEILS
jgi:hypothetical protein